MRDSVYTTAFDEDVQANDGCPECDGHVETNVRETVCADCGLVLSDGVVDRGPEWRAYDEDRRRRTGGPVTEGRHDKGLSTEIGFSVDAGHGVTGDKRRRLGRLRKQHRQASFESKQDRNLAHGLGEVRRISSALGLSTSVRDQACRLFRSAQMEGLLPGRSIEAMASAAVFGACRCNGLARTMSELDRYSRCGFSRLSNAYRVLNRELGLPTRPVTPQEYIPRLASSLGVSNLVRRRARALASRAEEAGVATGKHPAGFAGACLYVVADDADQPLAVSEVAEAADACTATIRAHRERVRALDA